ncbi:PadR family transcriptional regulator [Streptomyces cacaoi]|uniref:PadR family transcriptional regulator n=1 Tax=Streptomyces cacaoi TaxID=1898 RepID=UPI002615151B|nr:PadR family transcriptional regulator [Streptomyces cacaoi]
MSAIRLLVLGAVRDRGRAHGYQIRGDLEFRTRQGLRQPAGSNPGSLYHALRQLAEQGLLRAHERAPSTAGGPPRTEYETTAEGEREFLRLLRHALTAVDEKPDVLTAGIGFLADLTRAEAIRLLHERLDALRDRHREPAAPRTPEAPPGPWGHLDEIARLRAYSTEADARWTRELIARLESGAYTMAGEGEGGAAPRG